MNLLLDVSSINPETDLDCECAVLRLSRSLCDRLQREAQTLYRCLRELPDLYEVYFRQFVVQYYGYDLIEASEEREEGWSERFHTAGRAVLPAGVDLAKFGPRRIECGQEIVHYVLAASNIVRHPEDCFEFRWTAIPKHSDLYITTRHVTIPELQRYLAAESQPQHQSRRPPGAGA
jgi:hypothetical protein